MTSTIALAEADAILLTTLHIRPSHASERDHGSTLLATAAPDENSPKLRGGKALLLGLQLTLSTACNSFATGMITLGIVDIATDLHLDPSLVYWPVLAYNLTSSPLLIPLGAVADVFGPRSMCLIGILSCGVCITLCGLARDGSDLIVYRCLQGVGGAMFLPTSMSILSTSLASGKIRNLALATLGLSMVIGYAMGLVLGGVLLATIGWRVGFYCSGGLQIALFGWGLWTLPRNPVLDHNPTRSSRLRRLRDDIDWVGAVILCACIGTLSYVLAMIAEDVRSVQRPANAALLALSLLLVPVFVGWMRAQTRRGRPALIPGALWKPTFTTICMVVAFANAEMQGMELLASLFFQNVQLLSPLQTSMHLLPGLIAGSAINVITGSVVHRLRISWALAGASILGGVAPLLMAVINPSLPYWYEAFPAQVLYPFCIDCVYVISALVIADAFPARDQALAGAVFNTIANLGQALGLALVAILANAVTSSQSTGHPPSTAPVDASDALLLGYRAGFWAAFASMVLTAGIGAWGLRKAGAVGLKRD